MTFSTLMFPTVFLKNKVSIVRGDMLFRLGKINNSFPKRALLLALRLFPVGDAVEVGEECNER